MDNIILFGIILIILSVIGGIFLEKRFKIKRKTNEMSPFAKRLQFILLAVIYLAFIIVSIRLISNDAEFNVLFTMLPFFFAISIVRGFMEWKYNRKAKRWISEIFGTFIFTTFFLIILYFQSF